MTRGRKSRNRKARLHKKDWWPYPTTCYFVAYTVVFDDNGDFRLIKRVGQVK